MNHHIEDREDGSGRHYLKSGEKPDFENLRVSFIDRDTGKEILNPKPTTFTPRRPSLAERLKHLDTVSRNLMDQRFQAEFLANDLETAEDAMDFDIEDPIDDAATKSIYQLALQHDIPIQDLAPDEDFEKGSGGQAPGSAEGDPSPGGQGDAEEPSGQVKD